MVLKKEFSSHFGFRSSTVINKVKSADAHLLSQNHLFKMIETFLTVLLTSLTVYSRLEESTKCTPHSPDHGFNNPFFSQLCCPRNSRLLMACSLPRNLSSCSFWHQTEQHSWQWSGGRSFPMFLTSWSSFCPSPSTGHFICQSKHLSILKEFIHKMESL